MRKFSFYSIPTCLFVWIAEAPRNKLWQYISLSIWNKYLRKEGKLHQISTVSFLFNGQLLSMGKFHLPLCAKRYVVYECSLACNFSRPWNAGLSLDSYINKPQTEPINYNILLIRLFPVNNNIFRLFPVNNNIFRDSWNWDKDYNDSKLFAKASDNFSTWKYNP